MCVNASKRVGRSAKTTESKNKNVSKSVGFPVPILGEGETVSTLGVLCAVPPPCRCEYVLVRQTLFFYRNSELIIKKSTLLHNV